MGASSEDRDDSYHAKAAHKVKRANNESSEERDPSYKANTVHKVKRANEIGASSEERESSY